MASKLTNVLNQAKNYASKALPVKATPVQVTQQLPQSDFRANNMAPAPLPIQTATETTTNNLRVTPTTGGVSNMPTVQTPIVPLYQAPPPPDTTAQRQQILDQMRQRLGIQKQSQSEAIMKSAEQAKRDIQSQYLQGKAGELERLVNQGLASGMQGAEQSGQARNEILQRQLSSENQANAVTTQAQGDITALDRQYNDLIAQGDIEGAKMAIDDAWQKYNAQVSQGQFGATMNQNQSQFEANQAEEQAAMDYQKQQDAIQLQYRIEQDNIANALNAKQISMQEAQNRQAKLNADRDYKLNVIQTNYSTQKPYYKAKSGGGGETEAQRKAREKKEADLKRNGL